MNSLRDKVKELALPRDHRAHHTLFLRQPPRLSRAILWTLMGTTLAILLWAAIARIDQAVFAVGRLAPAGSVQEVQAPTSGVISEILVKEGQKVVKDQPLARLDVKAARADVSSLRERLAALKEEREFYRHLIDDPASALAKTGGTRLPEETASLAQNRAALMADNQLRESLMQMSDEKVPLKSEQKRLFDTAEQDRKERLKQATINAESAEKQLEAAESQFALVSSLVKTSADILEAYSKLKGSGGVSKVDFLARQSEFIRNQTQLQTLQDTMVRLRMDIAKAREEERNINTSHLKEAMERYAQNGKELAEIDTRVSRMNLDVNRQISQVEAELAAAEVSFDHHFINAPADGVVFDIQVKKAGAVVNASETILTVVPGDELIAKIEIPNKDIGFIREGMPCQVRVDSFPYREYGGIEGTLAFVGSDALEPTPLRPMYVFPAKIELSSQHLTLKGKRYHLQSGMSVSVNIRTSTRSVLSLFFDFLLPSVDRMREVR